MLFIPFRFITPKALNYLAFQSFDFVRTWWRFFQKRVVHTNAFITLGFSGIRSIQYLVFCLVYSRIYIYTQRKKVKHPYVFFEMTNDTSIMRLLTYENDTFWLDNQCVLFLNSTLDHGNNASFKGFPVGTIPVA